MAACPGCGMSTTASWRFCAGCGAQLDPTFSAPRVHLDDVFYNCQRCGKEARYAELPRCSVCKEPMCSDCVTRCSECNRLTCQNDVVDCWKCKRVGCVECFAHCESCEVHGLCPDHHTACEDCSIPTCDECLKGCRKCGLQVCEFCAEEHKTAKR